MLDLVAEEERITRIAGMPFEQILACLDEESPAALRQIYAHSVDRYLVLTGKGRKTSKEAVELDRLDSSLRVMFGDNGVIAAAARLLGVTQVALRGVVSFLGDEPSQEFGGLGLALGSTVSMCLDELSHTVIPVDAGTMAERARKASESALSLSEARVHRWFGKAEEAARSEARLMRGLLENGAGRPAWTAVARLLDHGQHNPGERIRRTQLCHRIAGLVACLELLRAAQDAFEQAANLVQEGLGT